MAQFTSLPADIHFIVLQRLINAQKSALWTWKRGLTMLAVCRQWRYIALPLIYNQVYIDSDMASSNPMPFPGPPAAPSNSCSLYKTNAGLIARQGCSQHTKSIKIDFRLTKQSVADITHAVSTLPKSLVNYKYIKSLAVEFNSGSFVYGGNANDTCSELQIANFVLLISRKLPYIQHVRLSTKLSCQLSSSIIGNLVNAYSYCLASFECNSLCFSRKLRFTSTLTRLKLACSSKIAQQTIQIHTDSLAHLWLFDLPQRFSWKEFFGDSAADGLCFYGLRSLRLDFVKDTAANKLHPVTHNLTNMSAFEMHFPVLESVHIANCPNTNLQHFRFPPYLERIYLTGSGAGLEHFANCKVAAHSISISVTHTSLANEIALYNLTNNLFGGCSGTRYSALRIGQCEFNINPDVINWTNLAELCINPPIGYTVLQRLLTRLGSLAVLEVNELTIDRAAQNLLLTASDYSAVNESTRPTGIKTLCLLFSFKNMCNAAADIVIQHLLISNPLLAQLHIDWRFVNSTTAFIDERASTHSFLSKVIVTRNVHLYI